MIRDVAILNFRCLRDVRFKLEPLTVFVGPNGSGKSAVLAALRWELRGAIDHWRMDPLIEVRVTMTSAEGVATSFTNRQPGRAPPASLLHLDPDKARAHNVVEAAPALGQEGSNLTNVFASLPRRTQEQLSQRFAELIPHFSDVDVQPVANGQHCLRFQDRWSGVWYSPQQVSDGSILLLAFLVLQFQQTPPPMVCIEEPERGLHPYLLGELVRHLRSLATGAHGRPSIQIVLATHSAELLDHVEAREVRFLSRDESDGSVVVEAAPIDQPNWKEVYSEYQGSVGALWLSGGLGGVPRGS